MKNFFITGCNVTGCTYNKAGNCRLNGLPMAEMTITVNHDSDICQAKKQLNNFKMDNILSKKAGTK